MVKKIGIVSPGDMGHSVGARLVENGLHVFYCAHGRSQRTRQLAEEAGIEAVPTYEALVTTVDIVLSILVPAAARDAASLVAEAMRTTAHSVFYVDCNAIAPQTAREVEHLIVDAGGTFLDASIIGGPPRDGYTPRIYVSGPNAEKVRFLNDHGLNIIPVSDRVGDASALKMCYASLTKGSTALALTLMTAARALGVDHVLLEEFEKSQSSRLDGIKRGLPRVSVKARRFVGEMEEMDKTYTAVGIDPNMLRGAAEIYRIMGATHLADRVPEDDSPFPSLEETLDVMVTYLLSSSDSG